MANDSGSEFNSPDRKLQDSYAIGPTPVSVSNNKFKLLKPSSSMGRALEALMPLAEQASKGDSGATISEIAASIGRERSQVSRGLHTLRVHGFVSRKPSTHKYELSWQIYTDAQDLTAQRLRTDGLTALEKLVEATDEACYLSVLSGDSTVTIGECVPTGNKIIGSWIGRPYPAYCSDAGQAVLWDASEREVRGIFSRTEFVPHGIKTARSVDDFIARLAASRGRGYSIVDEEAEPGLYSVAVPIHDFRSEVVAAMQVVGPKARLEPRLKNHVANLLEWSAWLESALSGPVH